MRSVFSALLFGVLVPALCLAMPQIIPPDPPTGLSYVFTFAPGSASKPTVSLSWEPSSPHTYLLAGYRVLRRIDKENAAQPAPGAAALTGLSGTASGLTVTTAAAPAAAGHVPALLAPAGGAPLASESYDDATVSIDGRYTYFVQAVDAKGNTSDFSGPLTADLGNLPISLLAPEPPGSLTSRPGRDQIKLEWAAALSRVDPVSHYLLFRSTRDYALESNPPQEQLEIYDTKASDTPPQPKATYYYRVKSVDIHGRVSDYSNTVSAYATGTVPPSAPMKLTAKVGAETISLSWEPGPMGTAPVTEYLIRRRNPPQAGGSWVDFAPRSASMTAYTDKGLEPLLPYSYEIYAVDAESNTSLAASLTLVPERVPFNKTGILLMPTAFSNKQDSDTGLNLNVMFSYYIGSLYETFDDPELPAYKSVKSNLFQPIRAATGTVNIKYSLLPDTFFTPCVAAGVYTVVLLNFSQPTSGASQNIGATSSGSSGGSSNFNTMGGAYVVASKWLYERAALHVGLMRGNLANDLANALPPNWELTIRHITPGGNVPELMSLMVDPGLAARVDTSAHLFFGGFQLPFTLPLYFTKWRTGLNLEYLTPVMPEVPTAYLPFMINAHLDNLPLFGFEFSYFKFYQGYEIVAFYHFRDLNW